MSNKFQLFNTAKLSIIAVTTRDTINFREVLCELTGEMPMPLSDDGNKVTTMIENSGLYYYIVPKGTRPEQMPDMDKLYEKLLKKNACLFVVNTPLVMDVMFDGGEIPTPRKLMLELMTHTLGSADKAEAMMPALGGVTLKEALEYSKITMVRDQSLTPQGMVSTRKEFFSGQDGLTLVDAQQEFYQPDKNLAAWLSAEKKFFLSEGVDHRLRPRGLLLDGPPGVGKTAGAKYIAEQWGVPLYRLDVATTQNKYLGESEANMKRNLERLDHEEPCVALFDEVEKIFSKNQFDGGFRATLMSQLLWWLAERKARVLVVMTTNKSEVIPPELYRERRIDRTMNFLGLTEKQAPDFIKSVFGTFGINPSPGAVVNVLSHVDKLSTAHYTQAALTEGVMKFVKASKLEES